MTCTFNEPDVKRVRRGVWRLREDLVLSFSVDNKLHWLHVPAGFESNLATVPWWLWWIFPPSDDYFYSVILHDYLYAGRTSFSRFMADALMREAMLAEGVPAWRRALMWWGVRTFGGWYWEGIE